MKKIIILIVIFTYCQITFSQQIISFSGTNRQFVNDCDESTLRMPTTDFSMVGNNAIITHHFSNASIREVSLKQENFVLINIKGYGYDAEVGKPQLPGYTDIIPLSKEKTDLQVFSSDYVEYTGFKIVPAQQQTIDDLENDFDWFFDDAIYNRNEFFPQNLVSIKSIQDYRGKKIAFVRINPIQYNPVTGIIRCYQNIQYSINNINTNLFKENFCGNNREPQVFTKQEKYIIVTNNSLLSSVEDFVTWKNEQGYKVSIISKPTWNSVQEVRDSIQSTYWDSEQQYDSRYLLIIGDYSTVPAQVIFNSEENYVTDHYFACIDNDTDEFEDLARGRIPISVADSVHSFLSFIIEKEKKQYFWNRGVHSAYFNISGNIYNEYRNCVSFSEDVKKYMEKHLFSVDRVYKANHNTIPLRYSTTYANGDSVAHELRRPNFSWNGSNTDIIAALQNGCDYVMYHGHGNYYGLEQINFTQNTIDDIIGNICSPIFFCLSCLSGQYVDVLNNGTVLNRPGRFGAKMLDKKISPALVVSLGNCNAPYTEPLGEAMFSSIYQDSLLSPQLGLPSSMYSQLFELNNNGRTEIGEMMRFGFIKMLQSFGTTDVSILETTHMHIFGDPSYQFPTCAPHELDSIDVYRLNDSICIKLNGLSQCSIIFIEEDGSGRVQAYKRIEDLSDNYCFNDTINYNKIIIKKNNSIPVVLNHIKNVYLQDVNMYTKKEYVGANIWAGRNVTYNTPIGDAVVKNGGSLKLKHTDKTLLEKGFKVEIGGKLSVTRQ